ncbi:hypothetical protein SGGMMB4_05108 [Sodalis glossinidius str. 'morsitans']|uniref:Uncharacterized protein n=1 Tax=Sodalis glossinidius (strain morsitans) TaxID=343509 RepID=A0A193QMX3_SODGM|nr:hypothetical protein SGGMMB4_05108 [Sodalis glossinidius str. 'morsitans']
MGMVAADRTIDRPVIGQVVFATQRAKLAFNVSKRLLLP